MAEKQKELGASLIIRDSKRFTEKHYDETKGRFVTRECVGYGEKDKIKEFKSFAWFYRYVGGNLKETDLFGCDFKGIDLKKFNIEGACISSSVLIEQSLYDDSFYLNNNQFYH